MCPRISDPFYIVSYYIKWVTTSGTYIKKRNGDRLTDKYTNEELSRKTEYTRHICRKGETNIERNC